MSDEIIIQPYPEITAEEIVADMRKTETDMAAWEILAENQRQRKLFHRILMTDPDSIKVLEEK